MSKPGPFFPGSPQCQILMLTSPYHEQEVCLQLQPALLWGLGPAVLGPCPPSTPGFRAPPSALRPLAGHSAVIRTPVPIPSLFLALSLCSGRAGTSCQRIPGSSLAWESGASRGRSPNRAGLWHKAPHSVLLPFPLSVRYPRHPGPCTAGFWYSWDQREMPAAEFVSEHPGQRWGSHTGRSCQS